MKLAMLILVATAALTALTGCQPVVLSEEYRNPYDGGSYQGVIGYVPEQPKQEEKEPWWKFGWLKKDEPKESKQTEQTYIPPLPEYKPGLRQTRMEDLYPTYYLPRE